MEFPKPLIEGILLKRYKRFLADVVLPGRKKPVLVHVPNSGSMKGCAIPNSPCLISLSENLDRKIPYTLEMVKCEGVWIGVNTSHPNKLMYDCFQKKLVKDWLGFDIAIPEVKISDESRIDLVLLKLKDKSAKNLERISKLKRKEAFDIPAVKKRFVEIKNVSYAEPSRALFPDSVTSRGLKHLHDLMKLVDDGHEAEICFVTQRGDCSVFDAAHDIDPEYAKALHKAQGHGVIITCWDCALDHKGINLNKQLKIKLTHPKKF